MNQNRENLSPINIKTAVNRDLDGMELRGDGADAPAQVQQSEHKESSPHGAETEEISLFDARYWFVQDYPKTEIIVSAEDKEINKTKEQTEEALDKQQKNTKQQTKQSFTKSNISIAMIAALVTVLGIFILMIVLVVCEPVPNSVSTVDGFALMQPDSYQIPVESFA